MHEFLLFYKNIDEVMIATHPHFKVETQYKINIAKQKFFEGLNGLLNTYSIRDNVFGYQNNECKEIESGYYNQIKEFDNFEDIIEEFDINLNLIRVKDDKKYLGIYKENLKDIKEGLIIDLKKKLVIFK